MKRTPTGGRAKTAGRAPAPATIDEYLARLGAAQRAALQRVRTLIHAAAPGVEEGISYQLPAFRLNGRALLWIGAAANHCALYGIVGLTAADLKGCDTSGRGTIRFRHDQPLPAALVRKIVKARVAQLPSTQPRRQTAVTRRRRSGKPKS